MVLDTTSATVYTQFSAVIESNAVVEIRPKVSGYLTEIRAKGGSVVKKGEVLFRIDDADFRQNLNAAKAGVQAAKAQVDNATLEVKKISPLVEKGILSPYELETKNSNLQAAKAALSQAEAAYELATINLGYTTITAPVSGVLGGVSYDAGALVSPSIATPLTTISGEGDIYAYFSIDEKALAKARENGTIQTEEGNVELIKPDKTIYKYKGKVDAASGIIDRTTGTLRIKVIFPNPDYEILSGSSGVLQFPRTLTGCITIPQSATFEIQGKIMAYVVDKENKVHERLITTAGVSGSNYVVESGLEKGERIVVEGVDKMKEDLVIIPKDK